MGHPRCFMGGPPVDAVWHVASNFDLFWVFDRPRLRDPQTIAERLQGRCFFHLVVVKNMFTNWLTHAFRMDRFSQVREGKKDRNLAPFGRNIDLAETLKMIWKQKCPFWIVSYLFELLVDCVNSVCILKSFKTAILNLLGQIGSDPVGLVTKRRKKGTVPRGVHGREVNGLGHGGMLGM